MVQICISTNLMWSHPSLPCYCTSNCNTYLWFNGCTTPPNQRHTRAYHSEWSLSSSPGVPQWYSASYCTQWTFLWELKLPTHRKSSVPMKNTASTFFVLKEWKPEELVHTIKYSNEILTLNCNQALGYEQRRLRVPQRHWRGEKKSQIPNQMFGRCCSGPSTLTAQSPC